VFQDVRQLARETLERSFQGKTAVTRRALSPLASIRDKLEGLSFLDGRFRAVVGEIDRLMAQVPKQGPIANGVLAALTQFFALAAQPDGLRTWAERASVWEAPQRVLPDTPPASLAREALTLDTEALIQALAQEGTSVPAPEPASASRMDRDAPASIEDHEPVTPVVVGSATEPAPWTADAGWFF
jgi:hypothetical protein